MKWRNGYSDLVVKDLLSFYQVLDEKKKIIEKGLDTEVLKFKKSECEGAQD